MGNPQSLQEYHGTLFPQSPKYDHFPLRRVILLVSEVFQEFGPSVRVKDTQELRLYLSYNLDIPSSKSSAGPGPLVLPLRYVVVGSSLRSGCSLSPPSALLSPLVLALVLPAPFLTHVFVYPFVHNRAMILR